MIAAASTPTAHALEAERVRSSGGIEAWLAEDHTLPVVSLQFAFVGAGSAAEPAEQAGVATLAAALLDEGAGPYDAEAFGTRLATHGIDLHFTADRDAFSGALESTVEHLDIAAELLRLAITRPQLEPAAVERERAKRLAALARLDTDPRHLAARQWWSRAFAGHPYARPILGTRETVAAITSADVRTFLSRSLTRGRLIVGAAGAVDAKTLAALLDHVFGALPDKRDAPAPQQETIPRLPGDVVVTRLPVPQSTVVFGQPGVARTARDYYAALVLEHILGGGALTSRLFLELREKRGLVYTARTSLEHHVHSNLMTGWFATENTQVDEAIALVREEWRKLSSGEVSAAEVEAAKVYLASSFVLRLDGTAATAAVLMAMQRLGLEAGDLEERAKHIEAVTLDDVKRVARYLLDPGRLTFSVAGDPPAL